MYRKRKNVVTCQCTLYDNPASQANRFNLSLLYSILFEKELRQLSGFCNSKLKYDPNLFKRSQRQSICKTFSLFSEICTFREVHLIS